MAIDGYDVHPHAAVRMRQRNITEAAVQHCIQHGSRRKHPHRCAQDVVECEGMCVILQKKKIVTVYSRETSARIPVTGFPPKGFVRQIAEHLGVKMIYDEGTYVVLGASEQIDRVRYRLHRLGIAHDH